MNQDYTALIAEYGAYIRKGGDVKQKIKKLNTYDYEFKNAFTTKTVFDTRHELGKGSITNILQAFQKDWTPKGDFEVTPHVINLERYKIDTEICPDEVVYTWLGSLADNSLDRKDYPLIAWILNDYLKPQVEEEFEINVSYNGVPGTIVPGTAGVVAETLTGAKKKINDYITGGRITPVATGALSTDPVTLVNQIEAFVKELPLLYRGKEMNLNMSSIHYTNFVEGMDTKYNVNYDRQNMMEKLKYFPRVTVKGYHAMDGSDKIWCTPAGNAVRLVRGVDTMKQFLIQQFAPRVVSIYNDAFEAFDFELPEVVFTNDQDLV